MSGTPTGLRETEVRNIRCHAAFTFALNGTIFIDEKGVIVEINASAVEMFGYSERHELLGKNITALMPESYRGAHINSFSRFLKTGQRTVIGTRVRVDGLTKSGRDFPLELEVHTIEVLGGREFVGFLRDITERVETEQEILHRMNNQSSMLLGIISLIENDVRSVQEFGEKLRAHVKGIFAINRLLQTHHREPMPLRELLEELSRSFIPEGSTERFVFKGADIELRPMIGRMLGVIFNELATNSAKYGALKEPQGSITVSWRIVPAKERPLLEFSWQDRGVPLVAEPDREGFGTRSIAQIARRLHGEADFSYSGEGMRCRITIML